MLARRGRLKAPQGTTITRRRNYQIRTPTTPNMGASKNKNGVTNVKRRIGAIVSSASCARREAHFYQIPNKMKIFYNYGEQGHMKVECPKADKPTLKITVSKTQGSKLPNDHEYAKEETNIASSKFLVNQILTKILIHLREDHSLIYFA